MDSISDLFYKIEKSANLHESLREVIFSTFRSVDEPIGLPGEDEAKISDPRQLVQSKREELHEILQNLDEHLQGKSEQEVAVFFSSLLDIHNQLYQFSTSGVISVKIQPIDYITPPRDQIPPPIFYTEISMVYTPEEIRAIQRSLDLIDSKHPLYRLFIGILDQAFDVNHFNEVSSYLLLEIADYLIQQLVNYEKTETEVLENFRRRHDRLSKSLDKTVREFLDLEVRINEYMTKYPALNLIPNLIRSLILIKLDIVPPNLAPDIIKRIGRHLKDYNQSKRIVAYDFSLMQSMQEEMLRKQHNILNLQSDVLNYTAEHMEEGFAKFLPEYERIMMEIETKTTRLDTSSDEYKKVIDQKAALEDDYKKRRKEIDVINSQKSLAEVQSSMVESALSRLTEEGSVHGRIYDVLKGASKRKIKIVKQPEKAKEDSKDQVKRMASATKREEDK